MPADDRARRRTKVLTELAARDLYAWFGVAGDADAAAVREAAARKRRELAATPMPSDRRSLERAFCDQGEKALLNPALRREYETLRRERSEGGRPAARAAAEREERLRAARERVRRYGPDDARMVAGSPALLADAAVRAELEDQRAAAAGAGDAAEVLREARRARSEGHPARALALAERASALAATPDALTTLGAALRDVGDIPGSERALRRSLDLLGSVRENAPAWTALAATLRARGDLDEAESAARRVIEEDEEDAHGWRVLALVAGDRADVARAAEAWERSARLGLDPPGALAGLAGLRKDCLARGDTVGAADVETRIARLRRG